MIQIIQQAFTMCAYYKQSIMLGAGESTRCWCHYQSNVEEESSSGLSPGQFSNTTWSLTFTSRERPTAQTGNVMRSFFQQKSARASFTYRIKYKHLGLLRESLPATFSFTSCGHCPCLQPLPEGKISSDAFGGGGSAHLDSCPPHFYLIKSPASFRCHFWHVAGPVQDIFWHLLPLIVKSPPRNYFDLSDTLLYIGT